MLAEVGRTIAAVDPAIAQAPQAHFLFVDVLAVWGSDEQQRRLFGDVLAGGRLGNGLAERGGKHAQDLQTRLHGSGARLRLQGRKYYCTGAITARWIGVSALDDAGRLVLAFVERDAPGVKLDEDWDVMGQRATVSGSAVFDDVAVDPGLVVPYESAFAVPQQLGARAQLCARRDPGRHRRRRAARRRRVRPDKARPFFEAVRAGWADGASTDPHTIRRYGELATKVARPRRCSPSAAATLDEVTRFPRDAARRPAARSRSPRPRRSAARSRSRWPATCSR